MGGVRLPALERGVSTTLHLRCTQKGDSLYAGNIHGNQLE